MAHWYIDDKGIGFSDGFNGVYRLFKSKVEKEIFHKIKKFEEENEINRYIDLENYI